MQIELVALAGALLVVGGALLAGLGFRTALVTEEALRLRDFVDRLALPENERSPQLVFRKAELSGSFRARVLRPWFQRFMRLFGRFTPTQAVEDLRRQLALAGNPLGMGPREFFGLRMLLAFSAIGAAFLLLRGPVLVGVGGSTGAAEARLGVGIESDPPAISLPQLAASVIALYIGNSAPRVWLRRRVRARQNRIRKALPDALDMLTVCADAGLGFDQALQRVAEHWKNPLTQEFGRVVAEMQMGVSRQAALRNMAERVDVTELSSFVAVIIQSDQLGMSIAQTLHSQAEQMRVERRFRAQEEARKAPLKMLFPLLFFVLPATLAAIVGPSVPAFIKLFESIRRATGVTP